MGLAVLFDSPQREFDRSLITSRGMVGVSAVPGGPGAARDGMFWWVLETLGRLWVKLFLDGPDDEILRRLEHNI